MLLFWMQKLYFVYMDDDNVWYLKRLENIYACVLLTRDMLNFFLGNMKIYLHFLLFFYTDMV